MTDSHRVRRWDIYDIADELADVPWMLNRALYDSDEPDYISASEAIQDVSDLLARLWLAAERGGEVGPSPDYAAGETDGFGRATAPSYPGTDEGMARNAVSGAECSDRAAAPINGPFRGAVFALGTTVLWFAALAVVALAVI